MRYHAPAGAHPLIEVLLSDVDVLFYEIHDGFLFNRTGFRMKQFDPELVSGSVFRSMWKLAWPVVLQQVVMGSHGIVDQMLVGHYVGIEGNAAIGVAWQLFLVIVLFIVSLFQGMSIQIAQYTGKQDKESSSRVAYNIFLVCVYIQFIAIAPVGYFLAPHLLRLANLEPEVMAIALPYARILFIASAPMFLMFLTNSALSASGDPRTPLKLALLTTAMNIALSVVLIPGLGPIPAMGASGAALGSCLSPLPSLAIVLVLILRHKTLIGMPRRFSLMPDWGIVRTTARIGLPTGVQAVVLNIVGFCLFRYIGSLDESKAAQAAYAICYTQLFSIVTWVGFGIRTASSTIMGQNIGAGKTHRGGKAVYIAALLAAVWSAIAGLIFYFFPAFLLALFSTTDAPTLEIGTSLLTYLAVSGILLASSLAITGGLQGAGDTLNPMFIAIGLAFVMLGMCAAYDHAGKLTADAIWFTILTTHIVRFVTTFAVFIRGRWRTIGVVTGE